LIWAKPIFIAVSSYVKATLRQLLSLRRTAGRYFALGVAVLLMLLIMIVILPERDETQGKIRSTKGIAWPLATSGYGLFRL
jgi:hypothetical protein